MCLLTESQEMVLYTSVLSRHIWGNSFPKLRIFPKDLSKVCDRPTQWPAIYKGTIIWPNHLPDFITLGTATALSG